MRKQTHQRGRSEKRDVYLSAFRRNVHKLIGMGYARLTPANFATSEEPTITGELVRAMYNVMESTDAPSWVVHYELPKDDHPMNVPGRQGKSRLRIDIEFRRVQRGPRPLFRFEAKRLESKNHPVSVYLGEEGLGCFLAGLYPTTHPEAGMIGYVQTDDEITWASKIKESLENNGCKYCVSEDGQWVKGKIVTNLKHTYQTRHNIGGNADSLTVYHTLLLFHGIENP